jgi:hypothetical protein
MKAFLAGCILTAGMVLLAGSERASAQYYQPQIYNPYAPPVFSPYLNLRVPGNPAINYFGMVKPQMDVNRQLQIMQQQQAKAMQMGFMTNFPDEEPLTGFAITGHPTAFFNYGHYYYNQTTRGGIGGQPVRGAAAPPVIVP